MIEDERDRARLDAQTLKRAADELMKRIHAVEQRRDVPVEYRLLSAARLLEALSQSISAGHPQTPQVIEAATRLPTTRYGPPPPRRRPLEFDEGPGASRHCGRCETWRCIGSAITVQQAAVGRPSDPSAHC